MDETMKAELLAILRELRSGASPVFQELVTQRVTYCYLVGGAYLLGALLVALVGYVVAKKVATDREEGPFMAVMTCAISGAVSVGLAAASIAHLVEAVAPMGRILEVLR